MELPTLSADGYELANLDREIDPSTRDRGRAARQAIQSGDEAQLTFRVQIPGCGVRTEHLWVRTLDHRNGVYAGLLTSMPISSALRHGQAVLFRAENILRVRPVTVPA